MLCDVSEGFLSDAIQANGNIGRNHHQFLFDTEPDMNSFVSAELGTKTPKGRNQSQMLQHSGMKLMSHGTQVI